MEFEIIEVNQLKIAVIEADQPAIDSAQEALDLMAEAGYYGADSVILHETNLNPAFFDLKTGLAGDVLLKFTNYRMRLAVIGDFEKYQSNSLQAFIRESNKGNLAFFVPDQETAIAKLSG